MEVARRLAVASAALALAVGLGSPASATIDKVAFTIAGGGGWTYLSPGISPFGLPYQPTISGSALIDPSKTGLASIIALDYVTGTRTWTLADLSSSSGPYFSGNSFVSLTLYFKTGGNMLGTDNTAVIADPGHTIYCNNCVTTSFGPVPEPATWMMLLLGVGGLGAMARRHRAAVSG